ncbi:lipid-binding SYLF domain-containing protein [Desulfopila aestuarii]|uniref:Lipid-binding SYLF domain-containing protein n=1 Tax=Desulfopila aestuarii DSM 18488 TaxID=1121416 RepID=A0A1M7XVL3_9BACT|nr:YSC84-related protein [Desulfopila aestuarii]SHO42655.1 Lipid-binding SYLF domain-containing protein [Desulfopila aestuarii DSM 18488]
MRQQWIFRINTAIIILLVVTGLTLTSKPARAASGAEISKEVTLALETLYASSPAAVELSKVAKGILVFPDVIKAGLVIGGQYGEGELRIGGKNAGYYNTVAASYGLQAGAQSFGYAMFLMTQDALSYLGKSEGWEVGVGPTVVVMDEGLAKNFTTSTAQDDIYAFVFGQKGLMAGIGLQGSKISKINPDE